jgi:NitT/TauT family transport system substrate-binding protein
VTDYISRHTASRHIFVPRLFQGFPEIKEAMIAGKMQAAFMVAPMAIALRSQGVPVRIVYLGHRYGSAVVVSKMSTARTLGDLKGAVIAVPSRFSDERLLIFRAMKQYGLTREDIRIVEMAPGDVVNALATAAIQAFAMGEPYPSQAEMSGVGRILFQAREFWPDYLSCVLVVQQETIDRRPDAVQELVDGIAKSGLWLEQGRRYRESAADFVGRFYYKQSPDLLRWALTNPLDRVMYTPLTPFKNDFDLITNLMLETGTLTAPLQFGQYVDSHFAEGAKSMTPWAYEPSSTPPGSG